MARFFLHASRRWIFCVLNSIIHFSAQSTVRNDIRLWIEETKVRLFHEYTYMVGFILCVVLSPFMTTARELLWLLSFARGSYGLEA